MRVLWVFAHQDDEIAAAARILEQRRRGDDVLCAFLAAGGARNAESLAALAELGVGAERVIFGNAPDGRVVEHLDESLALLPRDVDEVGTLAWEGGHQDHDAAHLVALALGKATIEVPLYHGFTRLPYRVMTPIGDGWTSHRHSLRDGIRIARLTRHYRSQRKTWLGLLPEAAWRLVVARTTYSRRAEITRLQHPPEKLFYERRFQFPRETFDRAAAPFIARLSVAPAPSPAFVVHRGDAAEGGGATLKPPHSHD